MNAIEFKNVSFAYADDKPVFKDASFNVGNGEFVALVGDNGSGKSTVAKLADAFLLPDCGKVEVFGRDIADIAKVGADSLLELRCKIGLVQQNPDNQFVASIVKDEVAFGPCGLGLPKEDVLKRVADALSQVGALDLADSDVNALSGGQKQRIAIADALAMSPQIFIFDEPTSMLDDSGKAEVMDTIKLLHKAGSTILLITHSAIEAEMAERVLKVKDGKIEETDGLSLLEAQAYKQVIDCKHALTFSEVPPTQDALVAFRDVSFVYDSKDDLVSGIMGTSPEPHRVFDNLNLSIFKGELVCVAGPNGSGKSTLATLMNGLLRPTSGEVCVCGTSTGSKEGANAARRRIGLCFQYPEKSLFCKNVLEEVAFGPKNLGYDKQEASKMAIEALGAIGIDDRAILESSPFDLSGGMQRKVAFASVLSMRPEVLVMDEPCAGLDISAHSEFLMLLLRLKSSGQTIVLITHDRHDMEILADRIIDLS